MITYTVMTIQTIPDFDPWVTIVCSDGRQFPPNEENPDYKEFLEWVVAGNSPEEVNLGDLG